MIDVKILDEYSYVFDIIRCIRANVKVPVDEFNTIGGRKSGKSTNWFLVYYLLCMFCDNDAFAFYAFRNQIKNTRDLLDDMRNVYDSYGLPYNVKLNPMSLGFGNNTMRIFGVNSKNRSVAKNAGLPRFGNVKYGIVFFEERYEFEEADIRATLEAVRSMNKDTQLIVINAANPWSKNSPYVAYCNKYMGWDINEMKTTGSQVKIVKVPIGDGRYKTVLFHYTNWRVAKEFLSESDINNILDTWNFDKNRALTTDLGLPGYEEGSIYNHVLHTITQAVYHEQDYLCAGGDYGWGRDSTSGKTVFFFGGATLENGIDLYGEYVTDNHISVKDPVRVAKEVVDFFYIQMKEYMNRTNNHYFPELRVRVDNMADGFIAILNQESRARRFNWLNFGACKKYPISDRIEITIALLSKQMIRVNKRGEYPVDLLLKEMEMSFYEKTEKQKRAKKDDHAINAFEYAIENVMYKFSKEGLNKTKW